MAALAQTKKRITQQTFDETVRENIEEFEMEPAEALADAIQQFKSQGVDLTNVDISGVDRKEQRQALSNALELLTSTSASALADADVSAVLEALEVIKAACGSSSQTSEVSKSVVAMAHGPRSLAVLVDLDPVREAVLETIKAIASDSAECKDGFTASGMAALARHLAASTGSSSMDGKACEAVAILCTKTELNKGHFVKKEVAGLQALLHVLQVHTAMNEASSVPAAAEGDFTHAKVVAQACAALKAVLTFDDLRRDFSGSYDSSRAAVELGFVKGLLAATKEFREDGECMAAVFTGIRAVACNDEAVQQITAGGGMQAAVDHLKLHGADVAVCRQAAALMRNLSGNDDVKTSLCQSEALELLFVSVNTHMNDGVLAEHVLATLAAMALRKPDNCDRIVAAGGAAIITQSMRRFPALTPLQRQGCLAVRNLVARNPHLREPLLEDDTENLLRAAGKIPGSIDAAYAALRDLKLEVEMVSLDENGNVQVGVQMFGQVKSAFKAVWDDNPDTERAMADAARSPAELGFKL